MHPTKSQSLIVLYTTSYLLGRILKVNCQIQVDPISSNLGVFVNGMCIVFPMEEGRRGRGGGGGNQYVANISISPKSSSLLFMLFSGPEVSSPVPTAAAALEEAHCICPLPLEQPHSRCSCWPTVQTYGVSFTVPSQMPCPGATCYPLSVGVCC